MKIPILVTKCPHCGTQIDSGYNSGQKAYLYGSPVRQCSKCKKEYYDDRYHEIAIEGIRPEDTAFDEESKKSAAKSANTLLVIGIVFMIAFFVGFALGRIYFLLPVFGIGLIWFSFEQRKENTDKGHAEKMAKLAKEEQASYERIKDPEYVKKLLAYGYLKNSNPKASNTTEG